MNQSFPFVSKDISNNWASREMQSLPEESLVPWVKEYGQIRLVSRAWRTWFDKLEVVWHRISHHFRVPLVIEPKDSYVENFMQIRAKLSSVHGWLGEIEGPVPDITQKTLEELTSQNPDAFGSGLHGDNRLLLILPSYIKRTAGQDFPYRLDKERLEKVPKEEAIVEVLRIPANLGNIIKLFQHPLKGHEKAPVFEIHEQCLQMISQQLTDFPKKVAVHIHRKHGADETKNKSFEVQKSIVTAKANGELTEDVYNRILMNGVYLLQDGASPDSDMTKYKYVRGREQVKDITGMQYLLVGGLAAYGKASIIYHNCTNAMIVVVPGRSVGVSAAPELKN